MRNALYGKHYQNSNLIKCVADFMLFVELGEITVNKELSGSFVLCFRELFLSFITRVGR